MKSAIYSPYLDIFGGGERYMLTIAEYLSQKGEVTILWDDPAILEKLRERFNLSLKGIKFAPNPFLQPLLKRFLVFRSYDVMVYLSDGSFPAGPAKKNILHLQVPFTFSNGQSFKNQIKLKTWQDIIVNSKFTKEHIDKTFGVNATVLYPPVDVESFAVKNKDQVILSVGRFFGREHGKKQEFMVEIFKKLCDGGLTDWKLVLAGSIEKREFYDQVTEAANGYPIEVLGNVSFNELKDLYGKASIYWHAQGYNEASAQFTEHFGITTVEAMAAGCVPVVINAGGQKEIVEEGKNGVLWSTEAELREKTLALIADNAKREALQQNAIASSKQFSKERFFIDLERIIGK